MKGLLLLVFVVSAAAFDEFFARFLTGFHAGVQESTFCVTDPSGCGRDLSLLASAGSPLRKDLKMLRKINIDVHDLENFFAGLIAGLQDPAVSGDDCSDDFTIASFAVSQTLAAILSDYNTRSFSVLQLVDAACAVLPAIPLPYEADCDFAALLSKLQDTTLETLVKNYIANSCDINEAASSISVCGSDPQDCGFGVGTIIREELGWAI